MIETEQRVLIGVGQQGVWDHVRDIRRWASLMPGMQACDIIDESRSRWTLKVGVGGLVRTVRVLVDVEEWDGPERVRFSFRLEGDPVQGGGLYHAAPVGETQTDVRLHVRVEGNGPMAPMWEAMGGPLLPKLAWSFADQLRGEIETAHGAVPAREEAQAGRRWSPFRALAEWLRAIWRRVGGLAAR